MSDMNALYLAAGALGGFLLGFVACIAVVLFIEAWPKKED